MTWQDDVYNERVQLWSPYLATEFDDAGEAKIHCPIHEDWNPSATYNLQSDLWHCFACNAGGSSDSIYILLTERSAHGFVPPWIPSHSKSKQRISAAVDLPNADLLDDWHQYLLNDNVAMDYLMWFRGLSYDEIVKRKLVARPDRQAGVCYGFPIFDAKHRLLNVRWYAPKVGVAPKRVWSIKGHGAAKLYPISALDEGNNVCIVEGEFDALILNSHGIAAVTSTGGAGISSKHWPDEWCKLFEGKTVWIIPDRDTPGEKFGKFVQSKLEDVALQTIIVNLPFPLEDDHGSDVSDFLLKDGDLHHQLEKLRELLRLSMRTAKIQELSNDPKVREIRTHLERVKYAEIANRHEDVLSSWHEPPSTLSLREELATPLSPPVWTIDRLHMEGSNSLLGSAYKTGKSTMLLNLMRSVADGHPFLGMFETHELSGRVAFWNYEISRVQFNRWISDAGIKNREKCSVWHLRGENLALDIEELFNKAVEWLALRNVSMLIIDPFARAYGGDENDNSAVGAYLDRLDQLKREAGVSDLVLSAHYGRAGDRTRGATRLEDWADSLWTLTRIEHDRYFSAMGRDVEVTESRLAFSPANRSLIMVGGSRAEQVSNNMASAIYHIVSNNNGQKTFAQLVSELAGQGTTADRTAAVNMALASGVIALDSSVTPARIRIVADADKVVQPTKL